MDKSFESLCVSLRSVGVTDPKSLTVFEFYETISYHEKKKP